MIVYEVNVFVQRAIETAYRHWLEHHVAEILRLPGFIDAAIFEVIMPASDADEFALCMHYRLDSELSLENYLRDHAPRLRADGIARFGNNFRAERRVLREIPGY